MLLDRGGAGYVELDDDRADETERGRVGMAMVGPHSMLADAAESVEQGVDDLRGSSTIEGRPWKTTVTTRAVSSRLARADADDLDDFSLSDPGPSRSEKSSADDDTSSSDDR